MRFILFTHQNMKHVSFILLSLLCFAVMAQPLKHTIISGKILSPTSKEVELIHFNQWEWAEIPPIQLDEKGFFRFDLQLDEGKQFRIKNSNNAWDLFYDAGDSVFLTLRVGEEDSTIQASGRGAAHCLWIAENDRLTPKLPKMSPDLLPVEAAKIIDETYKQRLATFEKYCLKHPEVNENFKLYYRLEYRYRPYQRKQMLQFMYATNHKMEYDSVPMPPNFLAYMDTIAINIDKYWISDSYQDEIRNVVTHTYYKLIEKAKQGGNEKLYSNIERYELAKMMVTGRAKWTICAELLDDCFEQMDSSVEREYQIFLSECPNPTIVNRLKYKYVEKQIMAKGKKAPNFTATDLNGKTVSLSDFEGKIVILDFWASWCAPCLRELMMENAQKLEEKYTQKGIVFLKVNIDANEELWKNTLDRLKIRSIGTHIHQAGGFNSLVAKSYGITGIPTYLILDKKGFIIENVPPRPSDAKLAEVLDKILVQ